MAIAGKVAITGGGAWNNETQYERMVAVTYNNNLYLSLKPSKGIEPTNTEFWMLSLEGFSGEQLEELEERLEAVQSTSKGVLSKAGWYRVAEYAGGTYGAKGLYANSCKLFIKTVANNDTNESIVLFIDSVLEKQSIKALSVKRFASFSAFTKCRYAYDSTKAYLEIYYNLNKENPCNFTVSDCNDYYQNWKAITPTLTQESVSGVTVSTTYDIPANASPVTDLDLANYLSKTGGKLEAEADSLLSLRNAKGSGQIEYIKFEHSAHGNLGGLGYDGVDNPVAWIPSSGFKSLLHTGNKPSGTYNGNGSATKRTIQIGGTGKVLCIQSGYYLTFAFSEGAITFAVDTGTTNHFTKEQVNFTDGVLTLATDSGFVNLSGYGYDWTVL